MTIILNASGTITIAAQPVPESLSKIFIEYVYPKGLAHLKPIMVWGGFLYAGDRIFINKTPLGFEMSVGLYDGDQLIKLFRTSEEPEIYISYGIDRMEPDLVKRLAELEKENKELKERGDVV